MCHAPSTSPAELVLLCMIEPQASSCASYTFYWSLVMTAMAVDHPVLIGPLKSACPLLGLPLYPLEMPPADAPRPQQPPRGPIHQHPSPSVTVTAECPSHISIGPPQLLNHLLFLFLFCIEFGGIFKSLKLIILSFCQTPPKPKVFPTNPPPPSSRLESFLAKVSSQESQVDSLAFHPFPPSSIPAPGTSLTGLQDPSSTVFGWLGFFFSGCTKTFFNQFQCIVQPVQMTITGNPSSTPGLPVLLDWLAVHSRFCNRFHRSLLIRLSVPMHWCFRPCNLLSDYTFHIFQAPHSSAVGQSYCRTICSSQELGFRSSTDW